ncbi:MAG TPA: type I phosphomannose isomerase catalytic subunit [Pyrinomonadaceae bacterium]|nr:type I phosphomannose isomerase catalytic subunit [Pyrinomonadaceae bacterium]
MEGKLKQTLFALEPQYREKVWGGRRLRREGEPVGESWVAFEGSRVRGGGSDGRTVGELAEEYGAQLLGREVASRFGSRFPLLVKLLDCADWLSVQVHPDDAQAERMVGPGEFGKSEAWHFLKVEEGAQIIAGVRPGTTQGALESAIRDGRVEDVARRLTVRAGETLYIPAGTLHALGPGMLLYEVQQSSDTTYRVYDWGRPAGAGRELHVEQAAAVTDAEKNPALTPAPSAKGAASPLVRCPFFDLDLLRTDGRPFNGDTGGQTFHVVTSIAGSAEVRSGGESLTLGTYDTALVAGAAGAYEIVPVDGDAAALIASPPAD